MQEPTSSNVGTTRSSAVEKILEHETDPYEELTERLDHKPLFWDPEKTAKEPERAYQSGRILGIVEERETRESTYKKPDDPDRFYEVTLVRMQDGTRVEVSWWNTVLKGKIAKYDPRPGDFVGVEFMGTKANAEPGWNDIKLYDAVVRKAPAKPTVVPDGEEDGGQPVSADA